MMSSPGPGRWRHRVDGLDAGLQRLVHRLAAGDAGSLHLQARISSWETGPCRRSHAETVPPARPSNESPTGMDKMRPVAVTSWPSSTESAWPRIDCADRLFFEVEGETLRAASNSSSSLTRAPAARRPRDAVADPTPGRPGADEAGSAIRARLVQVGLAPAAERPRLVQRLHPLYLDERRRTMIAAGRPVGGDRGHRREPRLVLLGAGLARARAARPGLRRAGAAARPGATPTPSRSATRWTGGASRRSSGRGCCGSARR